MQARHQVEEFSDSLIADIATGGEPCKLSVVTNRMRSELCSRRKSVALIDEHLGAILLLICGIATIDALSEFPLQCIGILDAEEADMAGTGHHRITGVGPGEVNLATGITEALGLSEIPLKRSGIVGAVVGAGHTVAEDLLSIGIAVLGEKQHHHELLVLIVDDAPLSTIHLSSIPESCDGLAAGRLDSAPGSQSSAGHRGLVGTDVGLRDEVATDGNEAHPEIRDAGCRILKDTVVELRSMEEDMTDGLIQSSTICIDSGIAHTELGCMAIVFDQIPATLRLEESPHVEIPDSAPL